MIALCNMFLVQASVKASSYLVDVYADRMRAELAGKLSTSSGSPQDRLEDTLTDAVFSGLCYLPRQVLAGWLRSVLPERDRLRIDDATAEAASFAFWPRLPGGAEPDVVIRVGSLLVIVEAKFESGFGTGWGSHQLAVEWKQGRRLAELEALQGPVVVAITADLVEPPGVGTARNELLADSDLEAAARHAEDAIVWCPWQSVAQSAERADQTSWHAGTAAIVDDLFELMNRRGVRFVYEGFKTADWWLLGAAAEAANERVYPIVAEFGREVIAQGAARGIVWGGNDAGVVWYESKHPSNTHMWHRNYIQVPLLHSGFGQRLSHRCALYVLFSFATPAIRAGWWFEVLGQHLQPDAAAIAKWLTTIDPAFELVESTPWEAPPRVVAKQFLTADWLKKHLVPGSWFRIERSWPPDAVTSTAPVIDVLVELADSLIEDGAILHGLEADGILDRSQSSASIANVDRQTSLGEPGEWPD
jgi:hypothetical protein